MAATRLLYVMDPMCSWCWGFAPVLGALVEQAATLGVGVELRVGGLRREQASLTPAQRVRILGYWQAVNAASGQLFDFKRGLPPGFVYDTEPACRALVTARRLDERRVWALLQAIQQAFYQQGEDLTQARVLLALAEQVGFSRRAFAEHFDSPALHQATEADFAWVRDLGISGFPTLLGAGASGYALLTNGYQPLEQLQPLLQRWLAHGAVHA